MPATSSCIQILTSLRLRECTSPLSPVHGRANTCNSREQAEPFMLASGSFLRTPQTEKQRRNLRCSAGISRLSSRRAATYSDAEELQADSTSEWHADPRCPPL